MFKFILFLILAFGSGVLIYSNNSVQVDKNKAKKIINGTKKIAEDLIKSSN